MMCVQQIQIFFKSKKEIELFYIFFLYFEYNFNLQNYVIILKKLKKIFILVYNYDISEKIYFI